MYFQGWRGPPALPSPKFTIPENILNIPVAEYQTPSRVACSFCEVRLQQRTLRKARGIGLRRSTIDW